MKTKIYGVAGRTVTQTIGPFECPADAIQLRWEAFDFVRGERFAIEDVIVLSREAWVNDSLIQDARSKHFDELKRVFDSIDDTGCFPPYWHD